MSQPPLISVVMPLYNMRAYIKATMDCILGQTFGDFEFLIVEGGSTDGTAEIVASYADPRVRVVPFPPAAGMFEWFVGAINTGLAMARGEFIARMDVDDFSLPTRFERQVAAFRQHPDLVLLGCGADYTTDAGAIYRRHHSGEILWSRREGDVILVPPIMHGSAMYRRSAVEKAGPYRSFFQKTEDQDMWLRLAETGRVGVLDEPLFLYRLNAMSITARLPVRGDKYWETARAFSRERLRTGSDPLQRGETVAEFPLASRTYQKWMVCVRNASIQSVERRRVKALGYAIHAALLRPFAQGSWTTIARSILRRW